MRADQINKAAGSEVFALEPPGTTAQPQQALCTALAEGPHQAASLGELIEERRGDFGSPGSHDDGVVGRIGPAAAGAVSDEHRNVFDPEALERFLEKVADSPIPVIAGIWPFLNLRNAEFLANEVPGVVVPEEIVERMRTAQGSGEEAALEEGVRVAVEMIEAVRPMVQGFHLSAPSRRVDVALRVLREAGVSPTA